jgi:hypothetical protein
MIRLQFTQQTGIAKMQIILNLLENETAINRQA